MTGIITQNKSYNYNKEFYNNTETQDKLSDPEFDTILNNTFPNEGGYVVDVGGPTNYGVTQKTFDSYTVKRGINPKSVKELSKEDAARFYYDEFYTTPKINTIPYQKVKGILFDYAINSGNQKAIKDLQKEVGVTVDGSLGPKTLSAVDKYVKQHGEVFLAHQILNRRANFMIKLNEKDPKKYPDLQGWLNRIGNLKEQYQLND